MRDSRLREMECAKRGHAGTSGPFLVTCHAKRLLCVLAFRPAMPSPELAGYAGGRRCARTRASFQRLGSRRRGGGRRSSPPALRNVILSKEARHKITVFKKQNKNPRGALFAKSTLPPEAWLLTRKTFICSVLRGQRLKPARLTGHRGLNRRAEERSGFCEREPGPKVRAEVAGPRASHALRAGSRTLARFLLSLLSGRNQMGRTLGKVSSGPRPHAIIQRVLTSFLRQLSPAGIPGRNPERDFIISILILAAPPLKKKNDIFRLLNFGTRIQSID